MIRLIVIGACGALAAAGCAAGPAANPDPYADQPLEPVLAWRENAAGDLVVRVQSNGCTTKDSFRVDATGSAAAGWSFNVALTRLHADRCRALLPQGVALSWTKDEIGLPPSAQITVVNPLESARPAPPEAPPR